MNRHRWGIVLAWFIICSAMARGDDAYFHIPWDDLSKIVDGKLPESMRAAIYRQSITDGSLMPYVGRLEKGEAYVIVPGSFSNPTITTTTTTKSTGELPPVELPMTGLFLRAPAGADISAWLYLPKTDSEGEAGMVKLKFKLPASSANDKYQKDFLQAKALHYDWLVGEGLPGGAWFRHEARKAHDALGEESATTGGPPRTFNRQFIPRGSAEDTYELFSGGRALSENLQLDRALPAAKRGLPTIDAKSLGGITIAAIDWKKYLKPDAHPTLDPLAAAIPEDQHAVFFASFANLLDVVDNVDRQGATILQFASPRSEDFRVKARYEQQLCLSTSALSRLLGPTLVRSVAVTGSDPYFPTGTDVAILFEAAQPELLHALLAARISQSAQGGGVEAKAVKGTLGGSGDGAVAFSGFRSDDRTVCSYLARMGDVVVVTNSLAQLQRLVDVQQHKVPTLAELQEYQFFRTRYPLGAADESALLFLSDPTIRRWCGPKWRIASSRRTRDLAVMNDLQADFLDQLVAVQVEAGPLHTDLDAFDLGDLRLGDSGVRSSVLGTLEFQTPIVELPWDKVTQQEADLYKRWRDNFQNNWRWSFDPVALRIHCSEKRLAADLTVMPLIMASDYRGFAEFSRGVKLAATAGDPHDAPIQWVMAINRDAMPIRSGGNFLQGMMPGQTDPLAWLGSSVAVWAEDDPFWDELGRQTTDMDREKFVEKNLNRLPVAVEVDVASRIKLTAFLVGLRGMIEQTAPGMVSWETLTYHDQAYVKLSPTERAKKELPDGIKDPSLLYAITPDGLLITLNQRVLELAIDRQAARQKAEAAGKPSPALAHPWIGGSMCLQMNQKAMLAIMQFGRDTYQERMQQLAWSNLPILNEWKRRFPDRDPVAVHEQCWQAQLICPGGGKYVWNPEWQTMESTVFGHPGEPKRGPSLPPALAELLDANFGLTFEDDGLRARLELDRSTAGAK